MALTAHNVSYTYARGLRAVNGASLEARKGELLGIIGPNGSGKSTLLRLMAGLLRPQPAISTTAAASRAVAEFFITSRESAFLRRM